MNRYVGKMEALRQRHGGRCVRCGAKRSKRKGRLRSSPLEFRHKRWTPLNGKGRGRSNRYHDILRNPDCYELVCRSCHAILDGLAPIEPPPDHVPF